MSNHVPTTSGSGPPSAAMGMHQGAAPPTNGNLSQQNLNQIVIEYLVKKGYNKTEKTLREESSRTDSTGRPLHNTMEDEAGNRKYGIAYQMIKNHVEQGLDVYRFEMNRVIWPMFVYSFIELILTEDLAEAQNFFRQFKGDHTLFHSQELDQLGQISTVQQLKTNDVGSKYYQQDRKSGENNPYALPLNTNVYYNLLTYLESNARQGGKVITYLLQHYIHVTPTTRGPIDQFSFETIIKNAKGIGTEDVDLREGIPGVFEGITNKDIVNNSSILRLGQMAMEKELFDDVRAEIENEDARNPPSLGKRSLVDEMEANIKQEDDGAAPLRTDIPLPPSRARDVAMEVQKIKEHRDRFRIDSRTGGVGPGVSVCIFTFHNTLESIIALEFSDDTKLIAAGTEQSYIRVWSVDGQPLDSAVEANNNPPTSSRRLIGHSAPVYGLSFAPSIDTDENRDAGVGTGPRLLLSCSSDDTIRLWSLETWTCLVVYKGHDGPVWDIRWGPHGHYFATAGRDRTVRVWGQDHISYLRMMVGHDSSVNKIAWHPNGAYIFSSSDTMDNSVRMWSFVTGDCVRVFNGHTNFISALECSPNGKIMASGDVDGSIILFDIAKGTMIKRMRGHGKGGIWSLSFSVESTVLVSGGIDGTVRVWDVEVPSDASKTLDGDVIARGGQVDAQRIDGGGVVVQPPAGVGQQGKKKGKDMTITPDQISAFPTKKTPVYKVKFTRMNLILAAGCYQP